MSNWNTQLPTDIAFLADRSRPASRYAGLAMTQHMSAPKTAVQGIAVPFAGVSALAAVVTDAGTPGSPPREAPV